MIQAQKDAHRAMELIRKHGWLKHRMGNRETGFCLVGAVNYAVKEKTGPPAPDDDRYVEAVEFILRRINQIFGGRIRIFSVPGWNDSPWTTRKHINRLIASILRSRIEFLPELLIPTDREFKPFYPPIQGRKDFAHDHNLKK